MRNRPFEHEQYLEILYPDVIGSGGAPKRITKPRRKGLDLGDSDDLDTPGTNVMNLLSPGTSQALFQQPPTSQTPIHPPTVPSNGTIRPSATTIPSRTSIASSSALTPPDDEAPSAPHSRKRFIPSNNGPSEKRRRTGNNNNYIDLTHSSQLLQMDNHHAQDGLNGTSTNANGQGAPHSANAGSHSNPAGASRNHIVQDAMLALSEFARAFRNAPPAPPPTPRWSEQAMEMFFRDFADEDPDLQIKIGEKVLSDTNKAMMFCLMSEQLRQHYVKRLRELHNRMDVSAAGLNSNSGGGGNLNNAGAVNGGGLMNGAMMQMTGPINGGGGGGLGRNGSQVG